MISQTSTGVPQCDDAAVDAANMGKKKVQVTYRRTVLRLPELDHSKSGGAE
jgi:hypothetical protein